MSNNIKEYLSQFPFHERGQLGNRFNQSVRAGNKTIDQIIEGIKPAVLRRLEDPQLPNEKVKVFRDFLASLNTPIAKEYAQYILDYENLSPLEREQLKAGRADQYKQEYLSNQQPSDKQLAYIRALGWRGELPNNKQSASQLIEKLLKHNEKGRAA